MTDRDSPAGRRDAAALAGYHARKFAELMELELAELQLGDQLWTQETDVDDPRLFHLLAVVAVLDRDGDRRRLLGLGDRDR